MKKLNIILGVLLVLGACMLNPLTPPPPAMDWNNPENAQIRDELIGIIGDLEIGDIPLTVDPDGTLNIPKDALPEEYQGMLPTDANGNINLELHSIEVQPDGSQHVLYKNGDSYVAAVLSKDGKTLSVKNSPTIDYGTIDWGGEGIFDAVKPTP